VKNEQHCVSRAVRSRTVCLDVYPTAQGQGQPGGFEPVKPAQRRREQRVELRRAERLIDGGQSAQPSYPRWGGDFDRHAPTVNLYLGTECKVRPHVAAPDLRMRRQFGVRFGR
jgi:hypothetical protein